MLKKKRANIGAKAAAQGEPHAEFQVVHIHLLDGTSKNIVIDAKLETVGSALRKLVKKLKLAEPGRFGSYFGLYASDDGLTASRYLSPEETLSPIYQRVSGDPLGKAKIFLRIRTITAGIEKSVDPPLIHLRYLQAAHEVVSGDFCCSIPTATRLAAHMIVIHFPDLEGGPASLPEGSLVGDDLLVHYVPAGLYGTKEPASWEQAILAQAKLLGPMAPIVAEQSYLKIVNEAPQYACTFFDVQQNRSGGGGGGAGGGDDGGEGGGGDEQALPVTFTLGINGHGINLLQPKGKGGHGHELLRMFELPRINKWGFEPGVNFYFQVSRSTVAVQM